MKKAIEVLEDFPILNGAKIPANTLISNLQYEQARSGYNVMTTRGVLLLSNEAIKNFPKYFRERIDYQKGDWVKLVSVRPDGWNFAGEMDQYLGAVVQLTEVDDPYIHFKGGGSWFFRITSIERPATKKEIELELQKTEKKYTEEDVIKAMVFTVNKWITVVSNKTQEDNRDIREYFNEWKSKQI